MKTMKCSPIPWGSNWSDDEDAGRYIYSKDGQLIANGLPDDKDCFSLPSDSEWKANIMLMEQAPQLLVMLRRIINAVPEIGTDKELDCVDAIEELNPLWVEARTLLRYLKNIKLVREK